MCRDLDIILYGCIYELMTWLFECMLYFCCDVLLLKFLCMSIVNYLKT